MTVVVNVPKNLRRVHEYLAGDIGSDEWHATILEQRRLGPEGHFNTPRRLIQFEWYLQWAKEHVLAFL